MKRVAFVFGAVLILVVVTLSPLPIINGLIQPQQNEKVNSISSLSGGMPSFTSLNSTGYLLAKLVGQTAPFKALADGIAYGIRPYQSFGYEWGPTIPSEEIITFFSPSGLLTIEVYVVTAPAPGTTSVNQSQIAYARPEARGNSTSGEILLLDLPLSLNGKSSPSVAPSFTPIVVFMISANLTGYQFFD
jgi:hypothetical protein